MQVNDSLILLVLILDEIEIFILKLQKLIESSGPITSLEHPEIVIPGDQDNQ